MLVPGTATSTSQGSPDGIVAKAANVVPMSTPCVAWRQMWNAYWNECRLAESAANSGTCANAAALTDLLTY